MRWALAGAPDAVVVFVPVVVGALAYAAYVRFTPLWTLIGRLRSDGIETG